MLSRTRCYFLAIIFGALLSFARGATNPQAVALLEKGDAEVNKHQLLAALADFEQADKLDPNDAEILLRLSEQCGDLIEETKNAADAQRFAQRSLDYAKRSVDLAPNNAQAHLALAIAYGRMTDYTSNKTKLEYSRYIKAEAERAIALDPREDYAYHVLGRWNYGIADLNPMLRMMAKVIYGGMPDASYEEAARDLKKAAEIAPQRIIHHNELARVYVALGKRDLAKKEWETVLKLKPDDAEDEKAQREARAELSKK
jgi:tetratricopeptide (TPR) repeat protein